PLPRNDLPGAWRVTDLLGMETRGMNEDDIGEIEDLLLTPSGRVEGVIIEGGGIFDIGDTHFRMDWHELDFTPGLEWVKIPMTEETVQGLADPLMDWDERLTLWTWRATELLDSTVHLKDAPGYGIVTDLIIEDSQARAVLVAPKNGEAVKVFPYGEYDPMMEGDYELPYGRDAAGRLEEFIGDDPGR
ncbi:MAG: PRC-barrel domain-containing protein, partial [Candidatus Competibacteraceae bacterium]|nr:PRC-barrel domain-containing protein [Candidatus Competibacteraceae bacterium]